MTLSVACTFNRFRAGDIVLMNNVMGIVNDETHAPYIEGNQVVYGKYLVHFPCGMECVGGEVLTFSPLAETPEDDGGNDFDARFALFFDGCQQIYKKYMDEWYPKGNLDKFSYKINRKYIRVIRDNGVQKSVHCFVDRTTGDVLKAASWKTPAKHARGNIFDDANGLGSMGDNGPAYIRG